MTEKNKRWIVDDAGTLIDMHTRDTFDYVSDVVTLLNELNDEIEFFKFALDNNREVTMEVEQEQCRLYKKLEKENNELKQAIKEVLELLKEEVDLFTDEATEHDIQAYIELRELDNKDAYYMATATKKAIKLLKEMVE